MNVCILVPAADVEKVREAAKSLSTFKDTPTDKLMNIALSESGVEPASHYFCVANVTQEVYEKMLALRKYSEMSTEEPKAFIQSKNLKVIPSKPFSFNTI